jgi:hypothetical protein
MAAGLAHDLLNPVITATLNQAIPNTPATMVPILYHWYHSILFLHRRFSIFPSPAGMSLIALSLGGNNLYMTLLFQQGEFSDIPDGNGNIEKLFLRCTYRSMHGL